MKKIIVLILVLGLAASGFQYRFILKKLFLKLPEIVSQIAHNSNIENLKQEIFAPEPLRGSFQNTQAYLTNDGVISWTNNQRKSQSGLPALKQNIKLAQAARLKLDDMFKKQYFEHVSPSGVGPGDLDKMVKYEFITAGENLALGNYKNDQVLVQAWMDSPGHRANILNFKYQEIGVATGKGVYEGQETWLAVQEFGKPASSCPAVSVKLKQDIASLQIEVANEEADLKQQKASMASATPKTQQEYNTYNQTVVNFNMAIENYNKKLQELKSLISSYNAQVQAYNSCAG